MGKHFLERGLVVTYQDDGPFQIVASFGAWNPWPNPFQKMQNIRLRFMFRGKNQRNCG